MEAANIVFGWGKGGPTGKLLGGNGISLIDAVLVTCICHRLREAHRTGDDLHIRIVHGNGTGGSVRLHIHGELHFQLVAHNRRSLDSGNGGGQQADVDFGMGGIDRHRLGFGVLITLLVEADLPGAGGNIPTVAAVTAGGLGIFLSCPFVSPGNRLAGNIHFKDGGCDAFHAVVFHGLKHVAGGIDHDLVLGDSEFPAESEILQLQLRKDAALDGGINGFDLIRRPTVDGTEGDAAKQRGALGQRRCIADEADAREHAGADAVRVIEVIGQLDIVLHVPIQALACVGVLHQQDHLPQCVRVLSGRTGNDLHGRAHSAQDRDRSADGLAAKGRIFELFRHFSVERMEEVCAALEVAHKVDALQGRIGRAGRFCQSGSVGGQPSGFGDLRGEIHRALIGDLPILCAAVVHFLLDPDGTLLGFHLQIAGCFQLCCRLGFCYADLSIQNILLIAQLMGVGNGGGILGHEHFLVVSGKHVGCGPLWECTVFHHHPLHVLADHIGGLCQVDGVFVHRCVCGAQQTGKVRQLLAGDQLIEIAFHVVRIEEVPDAHAAVKAQVCFHFPVGGIAIRPGAGGLQYLVLVVLLVIGDQIDGLEGIPLAAGELEGHRGGRIGIIVQRLALGLVVGIEVIHMDDRFLFMGHIMVFRFDVEHFDAVCAGGDPLLRRPLLSVYFHRCGDGIDVAVFRTGHPQGGCIASPGVRPDAAGVQSADLQGHFRIRLCLAADVDVAFRGGEDGGHIQGDVGGGQSLADLNVDGIRGIIVGLFPIYHAQSALCLVILIPSQIELTAGKLTGVVIGIIFDPGQVGIRAIRIFRNNSLGQSHPYHLFPCGQLVHIELDPQIPGFGLFGHEADGAQGVSGQSLRWKGVMQRGDPAGFHYGVQLLAVFIVEDSLRKELLDQFHVAQRADAGGKAASLEHKDLVGARIQVQLLGGHHTVVVDHAHIGIIPAGVIFRLVKDQHIDGVGFPGLADAQIALVGGGELGNGCGALVGGDRDNAVVQHDALIIHHKPQFQVLVRIDILFRVVRRRRQFHDASEHPIAFHRGIPVEESRRVCGFDTGDEQLVGGDLCELCRILFPEFGVQDGPHHQSGDDEVLFIDLQRDVTGGSGNARRHLFLNRLVVIPAEGEGHIEIIAHADGIPAVGAGGGVVDNAGGGVICQALCHQHGCALEGDCIFFRIVQSQLARHGAGNLMERPLHRCGSDGCAVTGERRKIHRAGDGLIHQLLVAVHIQLIVHRPLFGQGFCAVARHGEGIRRTIRPMIHAVHIPVLPLRRGRRCDVHGDAHSLHGFTGRVVKGGIAVHRHFPAAHHDPVHQEVADIGGAVFQIVDGSALAGNVLLSPIPALRRFGGDIQMDVPGLKDRRKIGDRQRRRQLIVRIGPSVFIRCKHLFSGCIVGCAHEVIGDGFELRGRIRNGNFAVKEVMPRLALGFEQSDGD